MSEPSKSWYKSKTVWGGVVAVVAGIAGTLGYGLDTEAQATLTQSLVGFGSAVGGVIAVYGRVKAEGNLSK